MPANKTTQQQPVVGHYPALCQHQRIASIAFKAALEKINALWAEADAQLAKTRYLAGDQLTAGIIVAPSLGYMDRAYLTARTEGFSKEPIVEICAVLPTTFGASSMSAWRNHIRFVLGAFCQAAVPCSSG